MLAYHCVNGGMGDGADVAAPASLEGVNQLQTREIGSAARRDLTVRVSYDECRTWAVARRIDEDAGYSSLVVLDDGTILCGYGAFVTGSLARGGLGGP